MLLLRNLQSDDRELSGHSSRKTTSAVALILGNFNPPFFYYLRIQIFLQTSGFFLVCKAIPPIHSTLHFVNPLIPGLQLSFK